ncbi:hypothetical protein [Kineosporia sp. NBRC 101731]|uniref:hypothetical protein n=1 Tax=Kineosporia sp. NBRC 101731 TaxID=3032199 RepID=UPI0024A3FAAC|nr:hypothetical protein [Kineosporia sp. NBRC 101731]GLY29886.1 hypothetical protein Kisp02_32510 [Kineosporia sp. NBRC 101731]
MSPAPRRAPSRRTFLIGASAAAVTAGCIPAAQENPPRISTPPTSAPRTPTATKTSGGPIGDGSTADTGPQPHQPRWKRLKPGEVPPQFVVFSWDGSASLDSGLFPRFRRLAQENGASMTFFLSGLYALPERHRRLYHPPQHPVGASDISFLTTRHVISTMRQIGRAWTEGHEIGTHFNGHFCGTNGVSRWSAADWDSEIKQAKRFVKTWKTTTGTTGDRDLPPLPFDYEKELIGGRTPCLEGQTHLLPTAERLGWRYDASSPGAAQVWPTKKHGLWDLPLQALPFPDATAGKSKHVLSMDYNLMYKQSGADTYGDPAMWPRWRAQARDAYLAGFERAHQGNRAPLFIGNHFEQWNGGIYMDAVEDALVEMAKKPGVKLVSFRQFVDWLDVQDPHVLARLRKLPPGTRPAQGWKSFLR